MSDSENLREAMRTRWSLHAREEQVAPPLPWGKWLFLGGRGAGKTRAGAEWVRRRIDMDGRIALVAPTDPSGDNPYLAASDDELRALAVKVAAGAADTGANDGE